MCYIDGQKNKYSELQQVEMKRKKLVALVLIWLWGRMDSCMQFPSAAPQ
jgi:hypothetical protein